MPAPPNGSYSYGNITSSCQTTGGYITVSDVTTNAGYSAVFYLYNNNSFSTTYQVPAGTLNQPINFTGLPDGLYNLEISVIDADNNTSDADFVNSIANISCSDTGNDPPTDTMVVTLATTEPTVNGLSDGTATINVATDYEPYQSKIDTGSYVSGKFYYDGLGAGEHTITILDSAGFTRVLTFVLTDPEIVEPGPNQYYAVQGVLPSPVTYDLVLGATYNGLPKLKHYIDIEIYANNSLLATTQQRVHNGLVSVDVSGFLKKPLKLDNWADLMFSDASLVTPFYIKYRESFNGAFQNWVTVNTDPKYAVQAAHQTYNANLYGYIVKEGVEAKWLTGFDYPVKFDCYDLWLSTIIDNSLVGTTLYWERSYYGSDGVLVERRSNLIDQSHYGKLLRLHIADDAVYCANYMDSVITDEYRTQEPLCDSVTPPIGYKIFDYTFDNSFN